MSLMLSSTYYVDIRTNCAADVRKCICIGKKSTAAEKIVPAAPTFCTHVLHLLMYVLHVPTVNARTYIEEKKLLAAVRTYLLLHVCTYCTYLVLVYLLMYARTYCIYRCFYWCTYVPTIRTALAYATSTHLLHKTAVPTVRTYCCTYS